MQKTIPLLAVLLLTTGCASIMTPEQQTVEIKSSNSMPTEVTLEGKTVTTPGVVTVLRDGSDKVIRTTVDGCDSATPITKKVTPVFFGNIIIGGLLGSTTDNATGKMWDYEDSVEVYCAS
jgi:uncharacterized protein YceK